MAALTVIERSRKQHRRIIIINESRPTRRRRLRGKQRRGLITSSNVYKSSPDHTRSLRGSPPARPSAYATTCGPNERSPAGGGGWWKSHADAATASACQAITPLSEPRTAGARPPAHVNFTLTPTPAGGAANVQRSPAAVADELTVLSASDSHGTSGR